MAAGLFGVQSMQCGVLGFGLHQVFEARLLAFTAAIPDHIEGQTRCLARGNIFRALGVAEDDLGLAHVQRVIYLLRRVAIIERREYEACFEAGDVMDDKRRAVRHQRCHAIAGLKPKRQIVGGEPARCVVEVGPRHNGFHGRHGRIVRAVLQSDLQQIRQLERRFQQGACVLHRFSSRRTGLTGRSGRARRIRLDRDRFDWPWRSRLLGRARTTWWPPRASRMW